LAILSFSAYANDFTDHFTVNISSNSNISSYSNISWDGVTNYYPLPGSEINASEESGLILLLHLNNDSVYAENNSHVYDFSGKGNNGTVINSSFTSVAKFFGGYNFNGLNDYITFGDDSDFEGLNYFSISVWVKNNQSQLITVGDNIIKKTGSGADTFSLYWTQSEDISFSVENSSGIVATATFTDGIPVGSGTNWHHVVGVYNGSAVLVYVDNVQGATVGVLSGDTANSVHPILLGFTWNGTIDEVAVWNYSLTSLEIQMIYQKGVVSGRFNSTIIDTNGVFNWLNASWNSTTNGLSLSIITNNNNVCAVNNCVPINNSACNFGANFSYLVNFTTSTLLDSILFDWDYVVCGNNERQGWEVCDGVDLNGETCNDQGYSNSGSLSCGVTCLSFNISGCTTTCNDGNIEPTETCDMNNQSCTINNYQGNQSCNSTCNGWQNCIPYEICGDTIINGLEECDTTTMDTCISNSYDGGSLTCGIDCNFNFTQCTTTNNNGLISPAEECDDNKSQVSVILLLGHHQ